MDIDMRAYEMMRGVIHRTCRLEYSSIKYYMDDPKNSVGIIYFHSISSAVWPVARHRAPYNNYYATSIKLNLF